MACTKKCHEIAVKLLTNGEPARIPWDTDTPNGEYEGSSEAILIDWLKTHGNYSRWRGNKEGLSKQKIQLEIAEKLNNDGIKKGILRHRTDKQVGAKIQQIERNYRETLLWTNQTGQGIKEAQGLDDEKFRDLVIKRWRHFYELSPIFRDRSCMGPVFHSDDLDIEEALSDDESTLNPDNTEDGDVAEKQNNEENNEDESEQCAAPRHHNYEDSEEGLGRDDSALCPVEQVTLTAENNVEDVLTVDDCSMTPMTSITGSVSSITKRKATEAGGTSRKRQTKFHSGEVVKSLFEQMQIKKSHMSDIGEWELIEKKRHNKAMEMIERQKLQAAVFQAADAELDYQLKLKVQYDKMKEDHSMDWIAQMFPQLICFFDPREMTQSERETYAKKYNEWNESRSLPGRM